jgi:hypothetical protein
MKQRQPSNSKADFLSETGESKESELDDTSLM